MTWAGSVGGGGFLFQGAPSMRTSSTNPSRRLRALSPASVSSGSAGRAARPADPDDTLAGLSARNRLAGFVEEVRIDGLLAQVRLRVGNQTLTAVITADAIHALKLKKGDDALAVIKSTEVMIAKSLNPNGRRR